MEALKRVLSVPIADPTRKEINEAKLQKKVFETLDPIREKIMDDLEDLSDRYRYKGTRLKIFEQKFPNEVYRGEKQGQFGKFTFANDLAEKPQGHVDHQNERANKGLKVEFDLRWDLVDDKTLKLTIQTGSYPMAIDNTVPKVEVALPFSEDPLSHYKAIEDWLSALFYIKGFEKVSADRLPIKRITKELQALKVTPEEWSDWCLRVYHGEFLQILESDVEEAESQAKDTDREEPIDAGFVDEGLAKRMKTKDIVAAGKKALQYHEKEFKNYKQKTARFDKGEPNSLMYNLLGEVEGVGTDTADWAFGAGEAGAPPGKLPEYPEILKTEALPEPAAAGVSEAAKTDEILVFDKDGQYMVGIRNKGEWDMFQMSPDGKNKYQGTGFQLKPPAGSEKVDWKSLPEQMQQAIKERKSKAVSALEKVTAMNTLKRILASETEAKKESDPSLKPPKKWWNKMEKEVKEGNPSYSAEQVDKTIGKIWADLSEEKKKEIREREGKTYGPAHSALARIVNV